MQDKPKNRTREYYMFAFRIMGDFGASIAVPIVVLALLGKWMDGKYHSSPLYTILGFVAAALISARIIYKKAKVYGAEYKRLGEKDKDSNQSQK